MRDTCDLDSTDNTHEKFSIYQQGGTCMASMENLLEQYMDSGKDDTNLGRWTWIRFKGRNIVTRVVVAYEPCRTRKQAFSATLAQHKRYWRLQGNNSCPRKLFRNHLIEHINNWRNDGEKLF